jgi:hypothetical protein
VCSSGSHEEPSPEGRQARHRRILAALTWHFPLSGRRAVRRPVAVAAVVAILVLVGCSDGAPRPAPATEPGRDGFAVLVFTRTTGFRHASIDDGVAAIRRLGTANGFTVDVTHDPERIQEATLKGYRVVVFLSSTGEPLDPTQQAALKRWVELPGWWHGCRPPRHLVPPAGPGPFLVHGTRPYQGELVRPPLPGPHPWRHPVGGRRRLV